VPLIELTMEIRAPIERCFDLSRDVELHTRSLDHTNERAIAGRVSGLIGLDEEAGVLGRVVDRLFLDASLTRPLRTRNNTNKRVAETG